MSALPRETNNEMVGPALRRVPAMTGQKCRKSVRRHKITGA